MARVAEPGECLFELLYHRAANESGGEESATEYGSQLFFQFNMRSN
jgi:hypothetical protein